MHLPSEVVRPPELTDLVGRLRIALGDRLAGLYLYGSAVCGGYTDGISDLDLLAVTARALGDDELAALAVLHERFAGDHCAWRDRVEVLYPPADELAGFRQRAATGAVVSPGEPLHRVAVGTAWTTNLYLAAAHGAVLHGPPAERLLPAVAHDEFLAAVAADLRAAPGRLDGPRGRGYHSYGVLTCARGWATLTTRRHLSKQDAAALASAAFPHRSALLAVALAERQSPDRDRPATPQAIAASVAFAHELLVALGLNSTP